MGRAADDRTLICDDRALEDDVFDKAHEDVVSSEVDGDDKMDHRAEVEKVSDRDGADKDGVEE